MVDIRIGINVGTGGGARTTTNVGQGTATTQANTGTQAGGATAGTQAFADDQNGAVGGAGGDFGDLDFGNVAIPQDPHEMAGEAFMMAGKAAMKAGNFAQAAQDFEKAAAEFEAEANALGGNTSTTQGTGTTGTGTTTGTGGNDPTGGGAPVTTQSAPPWTVKTNTLDPAKGSWSSVGDPHETNGDGLKFDNEKSGKFDLLQSASGDFRVQNDQEPDATGRWPGATLNQAVAVKDGNDAVSFDKDGNLNVNGQITPLPTDGNPINLPGGGKIEATADGIKITSSQGDVVNAHKRDGYLDLDGQAGPNRKDGEIRGALGEFHNENDVSRDLKGRTGDDVIGDPSSKDDIGKFEDAWKAQDDIFPANNAATGGTSTTQGTGGVDTSDPTGGGAPPAVTALNSPPTSPQWTVPTNDLTKNNTFASVGDPHETTGDGLKFDNEKTGQFDLLRSATGDLVVQNDQGPDPTGRWPGATLNHRVAIKDVGGNGQTSNVQYDGLKKTLIADGKSYDFDSMPSPIALASGGQIVKDGDTIKVTTSKQDEIDVKQQDQYLDITGTLGNRKDGEVRGGLGEFHMANDQSRDLKGRTGDDVVGDPSDPNAIDQFEEAWRVQDGQSLFDAQDAATAAGDPTGGGAPVGTAQGTGTTGTTGTGGTGNGGLLTADIQNSIRDAVRALNKAGNAHHQAAMVMLKGGDRAGAAKELDAAAQDYEKAAQLLMQGFPDNGTTATNDPTGGGAPVTAQGTAAQPTGNVPPACPVDPPTHQQRVQTVADKPKTNDTGFGPVVQTHLRTRGVVFAPVININQTVINGTVNGNVNTNAGGTQNVVTNNVSNTTNNTTNNTTTNNVTNNTTTNNTTHNVSGLTGLTDLTGTVPAATTTTTVDAK